MHNLIPYNLFEMSKHDYETRISSFLNFIKENTEYIRVSAIELSKKIKTINNNIKLTDYDLFDIESRDLIEEYTNKHKFLFFIFIGHFVNEDKFTEKNLGLTLIAENEQFILSFFVKYIRNKDIKTYPFFLLTKKTNKEMLDFILKDKFQFIDEVENYFKNA